MTNYGVFTSNYDTLNSLSTFHGIGVWIPVDSELKALHFHTGSVSGSPTLVAELYQLDSVTGYPVSTGPVAGSQSNPLSSVPQNSMLTIPWPAGAAPVAKNTKYGIVVKNTVASTSVNIMYGNSDGGHPSMFYATVGTHQLSRHGWHRYYTSTGDAGWGGLVVRPFPTTALELADGTVLGFPGMIGAVNQNTSGRENGLEWMNGPAPLVVVGAIWSGSKSSSPGDLTINLRINRAVVATASIPASTINTSTRNEVVWFDTPITIPPRANVAICCRYGAADASNRYYETRYTIHTDSTARKIVNGLYCLESTDDGATFTRHQNALPAMSLILGAAPNSFTAPMPLNRRKFFSQR